MLYPTVRQYFEDIYSPWRMANAPQSWPRELEGWRQILHAIGDVPIQKLDSQLIRQRLEQVVSQTRAAAAKQERVLLAYQHAVARLLSHLDSFDQLEDYVATVVMPKPPETGRHDRAAAANGQAAPSTDPTRVWRPVPISQFQISEYPPPSQPLTPDHGRTGPGLRASDRKAPPSLSIPGATAQSIDSLVSMDAASVAWEYPSQPKHRIYRWLTLMGLAAIGFSASSALLSLWLVTLWIAVQK